jgi:hypothetical protein
VLRRTRALFAWGPENAEAWQGCPDYHGAPIHVTGNPRVDMMRPELRPFFAEEAQRIRERFGSFVLVNSNFASLNHYLPGQTTLRAPESATAPNAHAAHRHALFRHFLELVPRIAAAFPEHNVVVRPHPVENHETWRAAAGGLANVHVVHEGSVIPWLLAARVMIHNSCTTGLEGYLLDAPIVAYRPVCSDDFDQRLPNSLSHEVFDAKALLDAVATALAGGLVWDAEAARVRRDLAAHHLAALDGPLASQRIADVLDRFEATAERTTPPLLTRFVGRVRAARRRRSKLRHADTPGHKRSLVYTRHRFPGIALREVHERIGRLGVLLGRFERVQARELGQNVFEVTLV